MKDLVRLGNGLIQIFLLQDVRGGQGKMGVFPEVGNILEAPGAKVVIGMHAATRLQQSLRQVGSHESGSPGDQNSFHQESKLTYTAFRGDLFSNP